MVGYEKLRPKAPLVHQSGESQGTIPGIPRAYTVCWTLIMLSTLHC